jgi:hypothetical protein
VPNCYFVPSHSRRAPMQSTNSQKQPYSKPQVRALGSLSAVTKSMMLGSLDDLTMGMRSMMMNPPMMM